MSTHIGAQTSPIGRCVTGLDRSLEVASPVALTSQFIQLDGLKIELLGYRNPQPTGTPSTSRGTIGLTHASFSVDDVDASAARVELMAPKPA